MKRVLLVTGLYVQIALGLFVLAALFLPAHTMAALPGAINHVGAMSYLQVVLPIAGLLLVGLPLKNGVPRFAAAWAGSAAMPTPAGGRLAAVSLLVVSLLMTKLAHSLYWMFVWDSTHDSFDILWLILLIPIALLAGLMLAVRLPRQRLICLLGLPLLPLLAYLAGVQVDYHELTAARAERVGLAIENYHEVNGRYPQTLNQLTPRYLLSVPEPTIIYGQNWCYEGGDTYYRLAYIDLEHWSSPNPESRIHQSAGDLSHLPPTCEAQFAVLQNQHPGIFYVRLSSSFIE
ncbi:MAG: hypothetical protein IPM53_11185 [Anaerolineaceae bacterium]|nr:hypothetical protein [Anaerolineaceae bacterium]